MKPEDEGKGNAALLHKSKTRRTIKMSKKVNLVLAGLVFAVLMVFLAAEGAEAFCIYNRTDTKIKVHQYGGGRKYSSFSAELNPGEKACCNWTNKDCNKKGKRDSTLYFNVQKEEKRQCP